MLLANFDAQLAAWADVKKGGFGGCSSGYAQSRYEERIGGGGGGGAFAPSGLAERIKCKLGKDGRMYQFGEAEIEITGQIVLGGYLSHSGFEIIKAHYLGIIEGMNQALPKASDKARALRLSRSAYAMRVERSVTEFGRVYEHEQAKAMGIIQSCGVRGRFVVAGVVAAND